MPRECLEKQADNDNGIAAGNADDYRSAAVESCDEKTNDRQSLLRVKCQKVRNSQIAHLS